MVLLFKLRWCNAAINSQFGSPLHRAAAMWIQVRTMDGKETHRIDSLSKLTKVDELRLKILELFKVDPEKQRLFYRGKQVGQMDTFLFNSVTTVLLGSLVIMSE